MWSGHIYFTLKDRGGAIACVMFAGNRKGLNFRMTEGMAVIVFGSVSVYERDGRYQLYAREIMQEGAGKLYEAYEALKKKLLAEGRARPPGVYRGIPAPGAPGNRAGSPGLPQCRQHAPLP